MSGMTPAASGVSTQILDLLANQKTAAGYITQRCHAEAPWMDFTHTATMDTLRPGDVLKFLTIDGEFEFKPKEHNALPIFEQIEAGAICAQMCPANELGLKVDMELIKGNEGPYMEAFDIQLGNTLKTLNQRYYRQAVLQTLLGASRENAGTNAGAAGGGLNLGTMAAPLVINVASNRTPEQIYRDILDVVVTLQTAKSQQELGNCVDSWKVLLHEELLLNFAYAQNMQHCCDMSNSMLVGGVRTFNSLFGNTTLVSSLMPKIPTATGFKTPIILTHSQASAFYGGITSAYGDEEFYMRRWILSETRGGIVLRPKHIFVAWVEVRRA